MGDVFGIGGFRVTRRDRRWIWWFLGIAAALILVGGGLAAAADMRGDPQTVVQVTSDAIAFQPDGIIDLVQLARPRFGLLGAQRAFGGIRLDPPEPTETVLRGLGFSPGKNDTGSVVFIQRMQVTPGCEVGIEQMVEGLIRVDIRIAPPEPPTGIRATLSRAWRWLRATPGYPTDTAAPTCSISAEMRLGPPFDDPTHLFKQDAVVPAGHAASIQLKPSDPLRLRRFGVSRLGFTTDESPEGLKSAVRGGAVRLPDYGGDRDTVYSGDSLTLGKLNGKLLELHIGEDGIKALFKGTASEPAIGAQGLKPSLLRQGLYAEDLKIVLAIIVGFVTVTMAIFQVVLRS